MQRKKIKRLVNSVNILTASLLIFKMAHKNNEMDGKIREKNETKHIWLEWLDFKHRKW